MAVGKPGSRTPSECPVCGAEVPPNAPACPDCGADERTGWNEKTTRYDGLDLPESAFDDGEPLKDDRLKRSIAPKGVPVFWWIVGLGLTGFLVYRVLTGGL